jgi:hypothetical protein
MGACDLSLNFTQALRSYSVPILRLRQLVAWGVRTKPSCGRTLAALAVYGRRPPGGLRPRTGLSAIRGLRYLHVRQVPTRPRLLRERDPRSPGCGTPRRMAFITGPPHSHHSQLTPLERRVAALCTMAHGRVLAPGFALLEPILRRPRPAHPCWLMHGANSTMLSTASSNIDSSWPHNWISL